MIDDYRSIPYDELDSNIPIGHGMIKWQPMATMPEQFENIEQMIHHLSLMCEPKLSQDLLELNERLAFQLIGKTAIIRYWIDGEEDTIECKVDSLDHENGYVNVQHNNEMIKINFYHIYEISAGGFLDDIV